MTSTRQRCGGKQVPGFPGYIVFPAGRIWSDKTKRFMRFELDSRGYCRVMLSKGGETKRFLVHRLVGELFIGPLPDGKQTRHLDGNKQNNALANIQYGTAEENGADRAKHGTALIGSKANGSRLNEEQVRLLKVRMSRGENKKQLAQEYGVGKRTIFDIAEGKIWKHV